MAKDNTGMITDIARLMIKHLVTRIQERAQGKVEGLGNTYRNNNFILRIVFEFEAPLHVAADGPAKFNQAKIVRVTGLTLFQRENGRLANMPRRNKIRFTNPK